MSLGHDKLILCFASTEIAQNSNEGAFYFREKETKITTEEEFLCFPSKRPNKITNEGLKSSERADAKHKIN